MTSTYQNASASTYRVSVATSDDIPDILALQSENQISRGGGLSVEFPQQWFGRAINDMPVVIARREGRLVGYLVSSSQEATQHLALSQAKYRAYPARPGSYNSGPLCIAASERGRGLVAELFALQRSLLPEREGVAFVRQDNAASRAVHAKYGFREVAEFSHSGLKYLVMSYAGDDDLPALDSNHLRSTNKR
jgi:L-amino acid N-acyltransferase YncA